MASRKCTPTQSSCGRTGYTNANVRRICEMQADTIVRRYPSTRIASLRPSWCLPRRSDADVLESDPERRKNDLWGYVQEDAAARAFLLAVMLENRTWSGHEAFLIVAPGTTHGSAEDGTDDAGSAHNGLDGTIPNANGKVEKALDGEPAVAPPLAAS